ncbi:MAG: helix-turn-helix domain-containing protein [Terrimicrobiaceae bacterium]
MERLKFRSFARPGEAYHAGADVMEGGRASRVHRHDFHEVFWVSNGSGVHRLNGKPHEIRRGSLAFIRPEDAHNFQVRGESMWIRNIAFRAGSAAMILESLGDAGSTGIFDRKSLGASTVVSPALLVRLDAAFDRLAVLPRRAVVLHAFLFDLVDRLLSEHPGRNEGQSAPAWLSDAAESLSSPGPLESGLAGFYRRCGRCQEHVARACRKHYGCSPSDLVNRHRLQKAASLLATTEESILGIAMDCGWNNLGHFYNLFKRAYQMPPRQFRQMARRTLR